ncbi:hypothetical protein AAHH79_34550, partial [Burkholderia pseudomallei]
MQLPPNYNLSTQKTYTPNTNHDNHTNRAAHRGHITDKKKSRQIYNKPNPKNGKEKNQNKLTT